MTEQATPQTCSWEEVGEAWETTCGHSFMLNDGTPSDNGMRYCCYCGKPLDDLSSEDEG